MAVDRLKVWEDTDAALGYRTFNSPSLPAKVFLPNLPDSQPLAHKLIQLGELLIQAGEGMMQQVEELGIEQGGNPFIPAREPEPEPAPVARRASARTPGIRPAARSGFQDAVASHAARTGRNVAPASRTRPAPARAAGATSRARPKPTTDSGVL